MDAQLLRSHGATLGKNITVFTRGGGLANESFIDYLRQTVRSQIGALLYLPFCFWGRFLMCGMICRVLLAFQKAQERKFDYMIIEASGDMDPFYLAQCFNSQKLHGLARVRIIPTNPLITYVFDLYQYSHHTSLMRS